MAKEFTKKNLQTGDIIETRNGELGVVILEKDCILYQAGGLDELDVFTEDLFVDGLEREGDIFKVYSDPEGPIGFNKRFGIAPVFRRRNDKAAKRRAAELSDKYDRRKGCVRAIDLEPCFRKYHDIFVERDLESKDLDFNLSEAPSMTACGQIGIDRTFVPIPGEENLYFLYNKYQEEWHLQNDRKYEERGRSRDTEPIVIIPEENIQIHSRSMIIRLDSAGVPEKLRNDDFEKAKVYLHRMSHNDKFQNMKE